MQTYRIPAFDGGGIRGPYTMVLPSSRVGKFLALLPCEELVQGRWEPFCSEIGCDGVFYEAHDGRELLFSLCRLPHLN